MNVAEPAAAPSVDRRGTFLKAEYLFGRGVRAVFADYRRPGSDGQDKRCLRVELGPNGGEPVRMELGLADTAALLAVLTGRSRGVTVELVRPGARKRLTVVAGSDLGATWVMSMSTGRGGILNCSIDADKALAIAGLVGRVLRASNPGDTEAGWLRSIELIGEMVAGRMEINS